MPKNAKDADFAAYERILVVGPTGSGKSAQIWTLPGRKFAYIFDPNSMQTLRGCDIDYELFLPEVLEMDATLKGFNKGAKSDRLTSKREPTVYLDWVENVNEKVEKGFFDQYDWLIFDSLTFLSKATMDRQLYINGRYGDIEDLADYRVVGSKLADVFQSIVSLPINIYATGHLQTFQDEKTKKITTNIWLPGKARNILPLIFTNVWLAKTEEDEDGGLVHLIRTKPEPRGLQDIRTSIPGLEAEENVTIRSFSSLQHVGAKGGIGALLEHRSQNVVAMR